MSGFRIESTELATGIVPRQRRPRQTAEQHLAFIRLLPCVICSALGSDPAHLRIGNRLIGKRGVGVGERPDDKFCAPLCRKHHDEQHSMNERFFWRSYGIENPWQLCLALYAVSGNVEAAEAILAEHRKLLR